MVQGISANQGHLTKTKEMESAQSAQSTAVASQSEVEAKEAASLKSSDTAAYTINDTSGEVNEAKELREQLESEGVKLKGMVKTFTEKSNESAEALSESLKQIDNYVSCITVNEEAAKELSNQAQDEQEVVVKIVKETEDEVAEMEDEMDFLNEKIE